LLLVPAFAYPVLAQFTPPHIEWSKSFGGSDIDQPTSLEPTSDKGFIIAGSSTSADQDVAGHHGTTDFNDYWIIKLDSTGNLQWQKSLGGTDEDLATSIQQTSDGGYIVVGHSRSNDGDVAGNPPHTGDNYWVVKLNDNGSILWQYTYGGSGDDAANDIRQTADGGYIIAGYSYSSDGDITGHHGTSSSADFWIVKLNQLGNMQWQKSYGGSGDDIAYNIRQTGDKGYAVIGYSNSIDGDVTGNHGGQDYWIIKIDSLGNLQWEKSYGGTANDNALSFDLTRDNGYILSGFTTSNDSNVTINRGQSDIWAVKLDSLGNLQWQKSLGGSEIEAGYSVKQTFDGGFITCGISSSIDGDLTKNQGGNDYWIAKLDASGKLEWQSSIGGPGEDYATCILQTSDSGFIVAGSSDDNGGDVTDNHDHEDYWVVKLGYQPVNTVRPAVNISSTAMNFPNPFRNRTQIQFGKAVDNPSELVIYNILGEEIQSMKIPSETESIIFNRGKLQAGVYVYRLFSGGMTIGQGRMIVE